MAMTAKSVIPENIQSLLDRADLSLSRGQHGEASTFLWKATEAAIRQAALAHGHKFASSEYHDVESFVDGLDEQIDPGHGLMGGYLITLEFQANSDGNLLHLDDVAFYTPAIRSFLIDLLATTE